VTIDQSPELADVSILDVAIYQPPELADVSILDEAIDQSPELPDVIEAIDQSTELAKNSNLDREECGNRLKSRLSVQLINHLSWQTSVSLTEILTVGTVSKVVYLCN
jgi:hypothetical protein